MTKDDIDKAAESYEDGLIYSSIKDQCDIQKAFKDGANWRINNVWHKASEEPECGEMALAICEENNPFICGPYHYDWETTVENFNIIKWAYVKDLTPNTEDR